MDHRRAILSSFAVAPSNYSIRTAGQGLINKSYKVSDADGVGKYFLQQIDHNVFHDVAGLMRNIEVTIAHLKGSAVVQHLELVPLKETTGYLYSDGRAYWRLYYYVEGKTYQRAMRPALAAEAGRAYGEFLKAIATIDSHKLVETIPRFHDIGWRQEQFAEAKNNAESERLQLAAEQCQFAEEQLPRMKEYYSRLTRLATKRVTHNDTKLANLIFDKADKAKVVVDYDTLMPGYLALDYGDAVRTICSATKEDSPELTETFYKEELLQQFTEAFINNARAVLNSAELKLLPMAASYMPFIMGLRMLTDYLNHDIYYSTKYPEHNLDRAKNQFTVFSSGLELQERIHNIVQTSTSQS